MSVKQEPVHLHSEVILSWRKALTSRLKTNLLKLNIFDLIGFVSEYTTVGSSNLISIGKPAFADGSGKYGVH